MEARSDGVERYALRDKFWPVCVSLEAKGPPTPEDDVPF